ncbi:MAG: hypothetical protein ACOX1K_02690 [Defluviitoga tunisiensis]
MKKAINFILVAIVALVISTGFGVTTIKFMNFSCAGGNEKYLDQWKANV